MSTAGATTIKFQLRTVAMATVVSQNCPPSLPLSRNFSKKCIFSKIATNFFELTISIRKIMKNKVEKLFRKTLSKIPLC